MSYRSKRTLAQASNEGELQASKKLTSPSANHSAGAVTDVVSNRWGPFGHINKVVNNGSRSSISQQIPLEKKKSDDHSTTKATQMWNTIASSSIDVSQPHSNSSAIWKNHPPPPQEPKKGEHPYAQKTSFLEPKMTLPPDATRYSKNNIQQSSQKGERSSAKMTSMLKSQMTPTSEPTTRGENEGRYSYTEATSLRKSQMTQTSKAIGSNKNEMYLSNSKYTPTHSNLVHVPKSKPSLTENQKTIFRKFQQEKNQLPASLQQQSNIPTSNRQKANNLKSQSVNKTLSNNTERVDADVPLPSVPFDRKANVVGDGGNIRSSESIPFKPRRRSLVPNWPDDVEFDEKEQVLTIDAEGKYQKISGSIQPPDVWHSNGVKYFVTFNEFYQPLRKGGHILMRFIGDVAKHERFCPISETNWHRVNAVYKVDIIKLIRDHFVIPDGDAYDQGILKYTGRSLRQYRHHLKKKLFKPASKSKEQIYEDVPAGHPRGSWIQLVDYWYSDKGKELSECGQEARISQNFVHTTGSTSYANIRADFEEKNAREPSVLEIFKRSHQKKDGTFGKDTPTEDFVDDVEAKVYNEVTLNPSNNKTRLELENEAFNKLMYGDDVPKRPVGYGYGVKQSDVFGVCGILRKEGISSGNTYDGNTTLAIQGMEKVVTNLTEKNEGLMKQHEELLAKHDKLQTKHDETNCLLKKMTNQFGQILDHLSNGKTPTEFIDLAKSILDN